MLSEVTHTDVLQVQITPFPVPYIFESWQKVKVGENTYENYTKTNVSLQYLFKNNEGYTAEIKVSNVTQSAQDPFSVLMNDLVPVNNHFIFEIAKEGSVQRLLNHNALIERWLTVKKQLEIKYNKNNEILRYLDAYGQDLQDDSSLVLGMKYRGVVGALFPSIYDFNFSTPTFRREKNQQKYFQVCDLPLHYDYAWVDGSPAEQQPVSTNKPKYRFLYDEDDDSEHVSTIPLITLTGKGHIREEVFKRKEFTSILKEILGVSLYKPVIELTADETYQLQKTSGLLTAAKQDLIVEVTGVYYNSIKSVLTKANTKSNRRG